MPVKDVWVYDRFVFRCVHTYFILSEWFIFLSLDHTDPVFLRFSQIQEITMDREELLFFCDSQWVYDINSDIIFL